MDIKKLSTKEKNTWCPGCLNNSIATATKFALSNLINKNAVKKKDVVIVTDIGCSSKVYDYIDVNAYYSLHGRALPPMLGIKAANPELTVIGFAGDGGTYNEGIAHLIHNARYNADMTLMVSNNQVFALTTGQETSTSEEGFKGPSTPAGVEDSPLNPVALALTAGATFVARACPLEFKQLEEIIEKAILHKGFSFIDILQPCLTFHNTIPFLQKHIYKLGDNFNRLDFGQAFKKAIEWDYDYKEKSKIALGIFYQIDKPTFQDKWINLKKAAYKVKRNVNWLKVVKEFQ
ncbi:2-oxoacid:ferredoxin oxidoreductase subunit beta [bacterium]|nr:2-oxoacid:ferredoxin oxidoreductase subunit beta [bacterium]